MSRALQITKCFHMNYVVIVETTYLCSVVLLSSLSLAWESYIPGWNVTSLSISNSTPSSDFRPQCHPSCHDFSYRMCLHRLGGVVTRSFTGTCFFNNLKGHSHELYVTWTQTWELNFPEVVWLGGVFTAWPYTSYLTSLSLFYKHAQWLPDRTFVRSKLIKQVLHT